MTTSPTRPYRLVFTLNEHPDGSMIVFAHSAESAISAGAAHILKETGERMTVLSVGRLFFSDEEETDFFNALVTMGAITINQVNSK